MMIPMSLRPQASRHAHVGLALPLACLTEQMVRLYHLEHDPRAATAVVPRSRQRSAPLRERDGAPLPASRQRLAYRAQGRLGRPPTPRVASGVRSIRHPPTSHPSRPRRLGKSERRRRRPAPRRSPLRNRARLPRPRPHRPSRQWPPRHQPPRRLPPRTPRRRRRRRRARPRSRRCARRLITTRRRSRTSTRGAAAAARAASSGPRARAGAASCALLALGADPALRDLRGWTALHHAAVKGHSAVAQLLIDAGGALDALTKVGAIIDPSTLFSLDGRCPRSRRAQYNDTPLHCRGDVGPLRHRVRAAQRRRRSERV